MKILSKLIQKQNLTTQESQNLMRKIMSNKIINVQKSAILTALSIKGETINEIAGMAKAMRKISKKVPIKNPLLDTCGTGGSTLPRLNVSTASAFILAACGVRIAKHGNRSSSGRCGSFDLLEGLGAKIELKPNKVAKTIKKTNLGFMFAPLYHPAMKHVILVRKKLGIRTVFNILGPLTNPAGAKYQILGISDPNLGFKMIKVLKALGTKRALIVYGEDGLDEITLTSPTKVWELNDEKKIKKYQIKPADFGLKQVNFDKIKGGKIKYNTKAIRDILTGTNTGPQRDLVVLNAGAGLYIYGKTKSIKQGIKLAEQAIDNRKAGQKLEQYIKLSKTV